MEVRNAAEQFLQSISQLRPQTQQGYVQRLGVFVDWCEEHEITLEGIKKVIIDTFIDYLSQTHCSSYGRNRLEKKPISTHTLAGYFRVIRIFLRWCLEEEAYDQMLKASVIRRIKMPKTEKKVIEVFTPQHLQSLFAACDKEMDEHLQMRSKTVLAILIDTGIRAAELCTLQLGNVHLEKADPYIKVHGKGNKWREVGLGVLSREMLERYIGLYREDGLSHQYVFDGRYERAASMTVWGLEKIIRRLGRWANIVDVRVSPHTFRHSFAVSWLLNGGDCFKLSLLLGHEKMDVTLHYLRSVQSRQARKGGPSVLDRLEVGRSVM